MRVLVKDNRLRYEILSLLTLEAKTPEFLQATTHRTVPDFIVPAGNLPEGTVGEVITYTVKGNGWKLAKVHQYRQTGASGAGPILRPFISTSVCLWQNLACPDVFPRVATAYRTSKVAKYWRGPL